MGVRGPRAWAIPWAVSALHGRGTGDLLDEVVRRLPPEPDAPGCAPGQPTSTTDHGLTMTPSTRPTSTKRPTSTRTPTPARTRATHRTAARHPAGATPPGWPSWGAPTWASPRCSTGVLGEERSVVHDLPGTTRDAIDTMVDTPDGPICFVDTAGMRRRSRTEEGTEYYAMVRALQALDRADVVLLVIDATEGVTHQDQRLAERIGASGSPVVVVLNKWELVPAEARRRVVDDVEDRLAFLGEAPTLKVSARTGLGVHKLMPALAPRRGGVSPAHPHQRAQPGRALHPGRPPRPGGPYPLRRARGDRPAHLHAVRHPPVCPLPTCATWSASSASNSASGPRR